MARREHRFRVGRGFPFFPMPYAPFPFGGPGPGGFPPGGPGGGPPGFPPNFPGGLPPGVLTGPGGTPGAPGTLFPPISPFGITPPFDPNSPFGLPLGPSPFGFGPFGFGRPPWWHHHHHRWGDRDMMMGGPGPGPGPDAPPVVVGHDGSVAVAVSPGVVVGGSGSGAPGLPGLPGDADAGAPGHTWVGRDGVMAMGPDGSMWMRDRMTGMWMPTGRTRTGRRMRGDYGAPSSTTTTTITQMMMPGTTVTPAPPTRIHQRHPDKVPTLPQQPGGGIIPPDSMDAMQRQWDVTRRDRDPVTGMVTPGISTAGLPSTIPSNRDVIPSQMGFPFNSAANQIAGTPAFLGPPVQAPPGGLPANFQQQQQLQMQLQGLGGYRPPLATTPSQMNQMQQFAQIQQQRWQQRLTGGTTAAPTGGLKPILGANYAANYSTIPDEDQTYHGDFDHVLLGRNRDRDRPHGGPMMPLIMRGEQVVPCGDLDNWAVLMVDPPESGTGLDIPPTIYGYNFCPYETVKLKWNIPLWGLDDAEGQVFSGKSSSEADHTGRFVFQLRLPDLPMGVQGDGYVEAHGTHSHKHTITTIGIR